MKKIKRQKASRVSPAVARLTVYRRLQVRMQGNWPPGPTRTYPEKSASFFEKVEFFLHQHFENGFFLNWKCVCGGACKAAWPAMRCAGRHPQGLEGVEDEKNEILLGYKKSFSRKEKDKEINQKRNKRQKKIF